MRILSVYYTHKPGGFCKRLYRLLDALSARGHEVTYLCLDRPEGKLSSAVQFQQIPFPTKVRAGVFFWLLFILWTPAYLCFAAARLKPDRYLVFGAFYSSMVLLASRLFHRAPVVLFLRSLVFKINEITEKPFVIRKISSLVDSIGILTATKVVVMSEAMKLELLSFLGRSPKQMSILPNDLPNITKANSKARTGTLSCVASGVADKRKNILFLVKAFGELDKKYPGQASLHVLGAGPELESIKRYAAEQKIQNCQFIGWVSTPEKYLEGCDLFIHAALHEGISNSVLEALAVGRPVLLSDIAEHREILPDEMVLFSIQGTQELVSKIARIIDGQVQLSQLASACDGLAEKLRFDWDLAGSELVIKL